MYVSIRVCRCARGVLHRCAFTVFMASQYWALVLTEALLSLSPQGRVSQDPPFSLAEMEEGARLLPVCWVLGPSMFPGSCAPYLSPLFFHISNLQLPTGFFLHPWAWLPQPPAQ